MSDLATPLLSLDAWHHGGLVTYPRIDLDSLGIAFDRPLPEITDRRGRVTHHATPVRLRLNGALGGVRVFTDPDRVRAEADRLATAADTLEQLQAANAPARSTLDLETTDAGAR